MYYFLSLGSNIDAEQSAVRMIHNLCLKFGCVGAYPFRYTKPEGIESEVMFLNTLVVLRSDRDSAGVKSELNHIEESMGRDRLDPMRSMKSRCADIDILGEAEQLDLSIFAKASEAYVAACLNLEGESPDLSQHGLAPYQGPASVYLDALTGDICVVEDEMYGLKYGLEATFKGE